MTPNTFFTRLKTLLQGMTWTGTSTKIFGNNVFVVSEIPGFPLPQIVSPTCYIVEGAYKSHEEHPNIVFQKFNLVYFVENVQSIFGEGGVLDANRTANTSQGVGYLNLEAEVETQVIKTITLTDKIYIVEDGAIKAQTVRGNSPLVYRLHSYSVLLNLF